MAGTIVSSDSHHWSAASWFFDWVITAIEDQITNPKLAERLREIVDHNLGVLSLPDLPDDEREDLVRTIRGSFLETAKSSLPPDVPNGDRALVHLRLLVEFVSEDYPLPTLRDLLAGTNWPDALANPDVDPLREENALRDARLNEVLIDARNARLGLLLDLRTALQLRTARTGLLAVEGVERFSWEGKYGDHPLRAWVVVGSTPIESDSAVGLRLFLSSGGELVVEGCRAGFFAGDVPGLPDQPPDFDGGDEDVAAGMASLDSPFEPTQATFLGSRNE